MTTIDEMSEPFGRHLRPVLAAGMGVCSVCHSWRLDRFAMCGTCKFGLQDLSSSADAIGFVALAVKHDELASQLWRYKDSTSHDERDRLTKGLTAVLWRWLGEHEACVARAAGVVSFPVVTSIASTKNRIEHPLASMVRSTIALTRDRYRPLLRATPGQSDDRTYSSKRFEALDIERGKAILIIDDTFTAGSRIQSAACTLKEAGSGPVGAVVIGRHFRADNLTGDYREAAQRYLQRSRSLAWDWQRCCYCDNRSV